MTDRCLDSHCEHPDHRDSKLPDLTPAEEAEIIASAPGQIGPGQTPISRPPSTIADAFAATLWLLAALLGESPAWTLTAIRALRPLIQRAAEEHARQNRYFVRAATSTLDGDDADDAAAYAEEHASRPVTDADLADIEARTSGPGPLAEDGALLRRCVAEIRALRKGRREAAQTLIAEIGAAGPEDIEQAAARAIAQIREQDAEIDRWKTAVVSKAAERDVAVTENGRLRSEVERLTAKLAGIEGVAAQGDGMMATISEQAAEIERLTRERPPADASLEARAKKAAIDAYNAAPAGNKSSAAAAAYYETMGAMEAARGAAARAAFEAAGGPITPARKSVRLAWLAVVRAVDASRPAPALDREALGRVVREVWIEWAREQPAPKASWLVPWEGLSEPDREVDRRIGERIAQEALASRPALAEEQAIGAVRAEMGSAWIDANPVMAGVVVGLLRRASRGATAPGHVSIPRATLESLVKATQYEDDVREAREVAKRVLSLDALRHEPARTDPEAARQLAGRQP